MSTITRDDRLIGQGYFKYVRAPCHQAFSGAATQSKMASDLRKLFCRFQYIYMINEITVEDLY